MFPSLSHFQCLPQNPPKAHKSLIRISHEHWAQRGLAKSTFCHITWQGARVSPPGPTRWKSIDHLSYPKLRYICRISPWWIFTSVLPSSWRKFKMHTTSQGRFTGCDKCLTATLLGYALGAFKDGFIWSYWWGWYLWNIWLLNYQWFAMQLSTA